MIPLDELATEPIGAVPIAALVAAVSDTDVDAGLFTDEELACIGRTPPHAVDSPWLIRVDRGLRPLVATVARRLLYAAGELDISADAPDRIQLGGRAATVGAGRAKAQAACSILQTKDAAVVGRGAIRRVNPELHLDEQITVDGIHQFWFRSPERSAAWLSLLCDPESRAGPGELVVDGDDATAAKAAVDAIQSRSELTTSVQLHETTPSGRRAQRALTTYSCQDGLWVFVGVESAELSRYMVARADRAQLVKISFGFLKPVGEP